MLFCAVSWPGLSCGMFWVLCCDPFWSCCSCIVNGSGSRSGSGAGGGIFSSRSVSYSSLLFRLLLVFELSRTFFVVFLLSYFHSRLFFTILASCVPDIFIPLLLNSCASSRPPRFLLRFLLPILGILRLLPRIPSRFSLPLIRRFSANPLPSISRC